MLQTSRDKLTYMLVHEGLDVKVVNLKDLKDHEIDAKIEQALLNDGAQKITIHKKV